MLKQENNRDIDLNGAIDYLNTSITPREAEKEINPPEAPHIIRVLTEKQKERLKTFKQLSNCCVYFYSI